MRARPELTHAAFTPLGTPPAGYPTLFPVSSGLSTGEAFDDSRTDTQFANKSPVRQLRYTL